MSTERITDLATLKAKYPKNKKLLSAQDRADAAAVITGLYAKGYSIRWIADQIERSYGFVHRLLTGAGVKLRERNPRKKTRKAGSDQK